VPRYDLPNAAPEPLRLVQRFVNTVDHEHGREWWPTPEVFAAWLAEHALPADAIGPVDLRAALELRSALQALLLANNGGEPGPDAVAILNRAAARLTLHLDDGGTLRVGGDDAALARVLAVALEAMLDGSWARLKACRQCGWAFYDYSRNRSGSWCSMQICGNRLKTRAYRRRKAAP
jgi:predicted RNA-binding Zn ribbon-like protein